MLRKLGFSVEEERYFFAATQRLVAQLPGLGGWSVGSELQWPASEDPRLTVADFDEFFTINQTNLILFQFSPNYSLGMVFFDISNHQMTFFCISKLEFDLIDRIMDHNFWTKNDNFGHSGLQKSLQMRPLWCRFMCIAEVSSLFPGLERSAGPGPISDVGGPTELKVS
jgi:hypothetical protein